MRDQRIFELDDGDAQFGDPVCGAHAPQRLAFAQIERGRLRLYEFSEARALLDGFAFSRTIALQRGLEVMEPAIKSSL